MALKFQDHLSFYLLFFFFITHEKDSKLAENRYTNNVRWKWMEVFCSQYQKSLMMENYSTVFSSKEG